MTSTRAEKKYIATAADAKYFPALIALLRSLKRTNPDIPVVVFDGGLTSAQAAKAAEFAEVIRKNPIIEIEGRGKFSYIGNTTLLKFEAASLKAEKVLYLDVDTIVEGDLVPVFEFPENTVSVVKEVNALKNMFRLQNRSMLAGRLDIDWESPGFNAGVFVIRPAEWTDLYDRAKELIKEFGVDVFSKSKDQQLLNIIFRGKTYHIPGRYNFSPLYDENKAEDPVIIHYLEEKKPWHYDYPDRCRYKEFRKNIKISDYPEILLVDIWRKIRSFLARSKAS